MRTQQEILDRIEERRPKDILDFEWPYYLDMLTFENAKPYMKEGVEKKGWEQKTEEEIREQAIDYMPFAWEKANNCRGISAGRSLNHYIAWLWMLGEDGFDDIENYEFYGKPHLERICEYFGLDHEQWDDGIRTNTDY